MLKDKLKLKLKQNRESVCKENEDAKFEEVHKQLIRLQWIIFQKKTWLSINQL